VRYEGNREVRSEEQEERTDNRLIIYYYKLTPPPSPLSATPILRSLFCGVGELYRVTKLPDTEELEVARVSSLPPLSTPLTTSGLRSDGLSPNGVLVTYSIKAKGGKEHEIRRLLVELQEGAGGMEGVMTTVVNQDEEDRGNFMMLQVREGGG